MNRLLTFCQRASKPGSQAFALLFCACLALASSCSKDYKDCPDCPSTPSLVPGTFKLVAADGQVLPYTPPNQAIAILGGDCVTTSEKFTLNITTATATDTLKATSTGFVLPYNRGTVTFHFSPSDLQAQAEITGNGFLLKYNNLTLLFDRIGG